MNYFSIPELTSSPTATRLGIDNTPAPKVISNLKALVEKILDPLRAAYGRPIHVNSGYRSPALNHAVGGVSTSQHLLGEAADITANSRDENERLYSLVRSLRLPVDQAINEHNFTWLHLSYRPNPRRQFIAIH